MLQFLTGMKPTSQKNMTRLMQRCLPAIGLATAICFALPGCRSSPPPDANIPLPTFGDESPPKPIGVYATIRRADIPLDQATDDAWAFINEQVVPPVTRGAWRGNGLRIGLLSRDQLDEYAEVMPQPVAFSRMQINRSTHPATIIETPKLRPSLRFETDLTLPPRLRKVETIKGGKNSTLRLLARIETQPEGQHTLILTPQHYIPSPLNLIPRDPFEKDMDGRVYDELSLRVSLNRDQIAVVGLHWPWPMNEVLEDREPPGGSAATARASLQASTGMPATDPDDPAAPPMHLQGFEDALEDGHATPDPPDSSDTSDPKPRYKRIAPPLETSFGSTLLTGTRMRQPVRTVLLITIQEQQADPPNLP